ncbi:MAG TPA: LUD domain-containing protein [Vicinamibacterales bacterium]|nr:LUD domain-containing protein [Vicinamibacterales bacterium]
MTAKERILGRLLSARGGSRLPRADAPQIAAQARLTADACLLRFEVEATALGVECYVERAIADVHARLTSLVEGRRVLSWSPEHLPYQTGALLADPIPGHAPRDVLASAEVGVTGCDAAVAETASLVMFSGPGRSRAVSLLPAFHVAIVERHRLQFSMAEVFDTHRERLRASASCTFITGPSRTADIELTLTLGIHGPGRVAVIVGP